MEQMITAKRRNKRMKKVLSLILALALVIMPMNTIAFDANTSSKAATVLDTQTFEDVQPGDQGQYSYLPSDYGTYAVTVTGAEGFQVGIYADPMMYNRPSSVLDDEAGVVETTVTTNMQLTDIRLVVLNNSDAPQTYTVTVSAASEESEAVDEYVIEDVAPGMDGQYELLPPAELGYGTYHVTVQGDNGFSVGLYGDPMMPMRPSQVYTDEYGVVEFDVTTNMQLSSIRFIVNNATEEVQSYNVIVTVAESAGGDTPAPSGPEGSFDNPQVANLGDNTATIAWGDMYFMVWEPTMSGTLTVTPGEGIAAWPIINGEYAEYAEYAEEYTLNVVVGDVVKFEVSSSSTSPVAGDIEASLGLAFEGSTEPGPSAEAGTAENPVAVVIGENTATISDSVFAYYMKWTATEAGALTITPDNASVWPMFVMWEYVDDSQYSESFASEFTINVTEGQVVYFEVCNASTAPVVGELELTFTASFAAGEVDDNGPAGTYDDPANFIMGTNTANAPADGYYFYRWEATASGTLYLTMKTEECPNGWWYDGAINGEYFDMTVINGFSSNDEDPQALRTLTVREGDVVTFQVATADMSAGNVVFSAFLWEEEVVEEDYVVDYENKLELGQNTVTLEPSVSTTIFEFEPSEAGTYRFETAEGFLLGYWGAGTFNVSDYTENKTNVLVQNLANVGPSIMVGVTGEGNCTITVSKVEGEVDNTPVLEWEVYENKVEPKPFFLDYEDDLVYFDVTDGKVETIVLGADGYYHVGTVDGPIVLAHIGYYAPYNVSFGEMYGYGQLKVPYTAEDKTSLGMDYMEAANQYLSAADDVYGVYPLTDDIITFYKELGASKGWYDPDYELGFYLFTSITEDENQETVITNIPCDENAWMFALCYVDEEVEVDVTVSVNGEVVEDNTWTQGTEDGIVIRLDAEIDTFKGLFIDGVEVPEEYYSVDEGSIIITLDPAYLDTLTVGEHTVAVVYTNATVTNVPLTIAEGEEEEDNKNEEDDNKNEEDDNKDEEDETAPITGDVSMTFAYVIVLMGAALVALAVVLKKKFA